MGVSRRYRRPSNQLWILPSSPPSAIKRQAGRTGKRVGARNISRSFVLRVWLRPVSHYYSFNSFFFLTPAISWTFWYLFVTLTLAWTLDYWSAYWLDYFIRMDVYRNCVMCRRGFYRGRYQRHLLTDELPRTRPEFATHIQENAMLEVSTCLIHTMLMKK